MSQIYQSILYSATPLGKRRTKYPESTVDLESEGSASIYTNAALNNSKSKSKETFVVLSTVLFLLVLAFIGIVALYFKECELRQLLMKESEKNYEILKACDKFELSDIEDRMAGKAIAEIQTAVTCMPCKKCHNYIQAESTHLSAIAKNQKLIEKLTVAVQGRQLRNQRLQDSIQLISRELVGMKFGKSTPYMVEMSVKVPGQAELSTLTFELHDLADIPYSTLYFLSQVAAGAWDSCSFISHHPGNHMLVASNRGVKCNAHAFGDLPGLTERLLFSEYPPVASEVKEYSR